MTKMDVMSINIHRMFEYLFCADESSSFLNLRFENDVKMYGTQTFAAASCILCKFENDVKNVWYSNARSVVSIIRSV